MKHEQLNLPEFAARLRADEGKEQIYDIYRKKWVVLTPEEWVRQSFLSYMCEHLGYPPSHISVEKMIKIGTLGKRFDAIVYGSSLQPAIILEFKAPSVPLTQATLTQAGTYNSRARAPYVIVSNGIRHYCACVDFASSEIEFLDHIPEYSDLK